MRKLLIAAALCASGTANAADVLVFGTSEVFDPATGLDWSYLTPVGSQSLDSIENRTDGQRLATAAEVRTFFSDAGIPPSGIFSGPDLSGLLLLFFKWGYGVDIMFPSSTAENFITAPDSGQVGYVGTGVIGGASDNSFIDEADGTPTLYPPAAFGSGRFGAALVSAVPEPDTYALMLLGLAGFAIRRRLNKSSSNPIAEA